MCRQFVFSIRRKKPLSTPTWLFASLMQQGIILTSHWYLYSRIRASVNSFDIFSRIMVGARKNANSLCVCTLHSLRGALKERNSIPTIKEFDLCLSWLTASCEKTSNFWWFSIHWLSPFWQQLWHNERLQNSQIWEEIHSNLLHILNLT